MDSLELKVRKKEREKKNARQLNQSKEVYAVYLPLCTSDGTASI